VNRLAPIGFFLLCIISAHAAQYAAGPSRQYKNLQAIAKLLRPGDTVTVDGGATYPGGVTLSANGAAGAGVITITGLAVNGARPVISGILPGANFVLRILGSHYLIQGFDLTAASDPHASRCFYNVGDDVTLRDSAVHDCHCTGISGADASGSLTLDGVEVYRCGNGLYAHQIYVGSGIAKYPNAVFLMKHCYVHDGAGGNNVKSRVTRNIIEYNWIEGAKFHDLDLDGPDPKANKGSPHCDADVLGNVLIVSPSAAGTVARIGGDGTGTSRGRYRFAYNTVIVRGKAATGLGLLWLKGEVDSLGAWNNVFWSDAGPFRLTRMESNPPPSTIAGAGNWVSAGASNIPPGLGVIQGNDPKFQNAASGDYTPAAGSPLIDAGSASPLQAEQIPPVREAAAGGVRPPARKRDIGAYPAPNR
jgi:hypothetical protein